MTTNKPTKAIIEITAEGELFVQGSFDAINRLHALIGESELLRAAIRRLCNIYVVDDYYDGQLREDRLDEAVNRAINAVMETPDAP